MGPKAIEQHLQLGIQHHSAGQLLQAEQVYRQVLKQDPQNASALNLLGLALHQRGDAGAGVELIQRAIAVAPKYAGAFSNLGNALRDMGRLDEAIVACRKAISLDPQMTQALVNLASALQMKGLIDEAIAACRQATAIKPDYAEAYSNLASALNEKLQPDEAIIASRKALALNPKLPEAATCLGNALKEKGRLEEAIAAHRQALALRPHWTDALCNLGSALEAAGRLDEAIAAYRTGLATQPNHVQSLNNLGNALRARGMPDEAEKMLRAALLCKPDSPVALNNLATVLQDQGRVDDAIAACRKAIALKPDYPEAFSNLGNVLKDTGRLGEAIAAYRQAVALRPLLTSADSNLVYTMLFDSACDARAIATELQRWNARHAQPLVRLIAPHTHDPNPQRRLRIGYVSPDFRRHVVGRNLVPLFREHDPRAFEIICYSQVQRPDELTHEFQQMVAEYYPIAGLSDEQVAQKIRDDRIDILVDLTLHMAEHRLLVFARKPAPVQVSFAGYPGSTGVTAIDYRLSDPFLEAPADDSTLPGDHPVCLPDSFWCYHPLECAGIPVNPLPASETGVVTFGCLNNFCKINEAVLRLWARVMCDVPRSRLMLLAREGTHRQAAQGVLRAHGIDPHRISFVTYQPRQDYLKLYHQIDLGLDTFPYNGHTSSLDSLWMGVPVVTLPGQTPVSRAGWSQLNNLQLTELAAQSPDDFVRIAVAWATDLSRLAQLRAILRDRMERSPLMDAPRFAANIEAAYRQMWQAWCERDSPR